MFDGYSIMRMFFSSFSMFCFDFLLSQHISTALQREKLPATVEVESKLASVCI